MYRKDPAKYKQNKVVNIMSENKYGVVPSMDAQMESLYTKNISNLTQVEETVVGLCSTSCTFGGHWGLFKPANKTYFNDLVKLFTADLRRGTLKMYKVKNGVVVEAKPEWLDALFVKLFETPLVDYKQLRKQREQEQDILLKFLNGIFYSQDSTPFMRYVPNGRVFKIAIYGETATHQVQYNGVAYPAFCLTLLEFLNVLKNVPLRNKIQLVLPQKPTNSNNDTCLVPLNSVLQTKQYVIELFKAMEITDGMDGLFVEIYLQG